MAAALQKRAITHRFLLENISWETYERLLRELKDRHVRLTYDDGDLEIMTVSYAHEGAGDFLGVLVRHLALELHMPLRGGGSTTLRRRLNKKGLEADRCFWLRHEPAMRGKKQWRARQDPPPDLALEIEISRSALNRVKIYAALRVPEVWRYDGKHLRAFLLNETGKYEASEQSLAFPGIPLEQLARFVQKSRQMDETELLMEFIS